MRISAMAASVASLLLVVVLTVLMSSSLAASARGDSLLLLPSSEKQDERQDEKQLLTPVHNLVRAIFAFGDSGLDTGTNSLFPTMMRADFKPYGQNFSGGATGRFTNGRNYADFFASYMNVSFMEPYLAKMGNSTSGVNYASGGSGVYYSTNWNNHVIPIPDQISQFQQTKLSIENLLKNNASTRLGAMSLYIISVGEYDMLDYLLSDSWDPLENFINGLVSSIVNQVVTLWNGGAGAEKFLIIGMRNLGCLPAVLAAKHVKDGSCVEFFNNAAKRFNEVMESYVKQLPLWYPPTRVIFGNPYNIFSQFTEPGNSFGFKSRSSACCGYGPYNAKVQCGRPAELVKNPSTFLCKNVEEYVYWDLYNPTEKAYKLAAELFWKGNSTYVTPYNLETLASICMYKNQDCKW